MSLFSRATARFRSVMRLPRFRSSGWSNANCRLDRRLGLMSENRELDEDRLFCQLIEKVPPDETGCWSSTFRGDRLVLGDQSAVELRGRGPAVAVDVGVDSEHRVVDAIRLVDLEQRLGALVALDQQSEIVLQGDRDRLVQFQPELPVGDVQIGCDRLGDPRRTDLHLPRCRRSPDGGRDEDGAECDDRRR